MRLQKDIAKLPVYASILTTILVIPSLADPVNIPKLLILIITGLFCLFHLSLNMSKEFLKSNAFVIGIVSFFIIALLSATIQSNQTAYRSLLGAWGRNNGLFSYIALAIIFVFVSTSRSKELLVLTIKSLTYIGIFGAIYGLLQLCNADPISWVHAGNKIILTLGNSDFASALLGLTAISTLVNLIGFHNKKWLKVLYVLSYLVQIYLVKKSDALQGLLILLLGSFLVIGFWMANSKSARLKKSSIIWWGFGAILSTLGTFGIFGKGPFAHLLASSFNSLHDRFYHWVAAAKMIQAKPFSGVGIDAFGDYYRQFRLIEAIKLRGNASSGTNNAHNVLMQLGATGGLPLLISYVTLIIFIGFRAYKSIKNFENRFLASALFVLWFSFQIQSFVSIDQIGLTIWGWILGACIVGISYEKSGIAESGVNKNSSLTSRDKTSYSSKIAAISILMIGIIPIFLVSNTLFKSGLLKSRINSLINSQSISAEEVNRNSKLLFEYSLTLSEPETRMTAINILLRANAIEIALNLSEDTARKFPKHYAAWDQVAIIYEGTNRKRQAIPARLKMVKIDPLNEDIRKLLEQDKSI